MANILVLGGTRFFGKELVERLLSDGHHVSIGTRGNVLPEFSHSVEYLKLNRHDIGSMSAALKGRAWDVVYDQICMDSTDAAHAIEVFGSRIGQYVFTSSLAVYDKKIKRNTTEQCFDPTTYSAEIRHLADVGYAEGKRLAEALFYRQAKFPVVSVRFPIVLGIDDYTQRLLKPTIDILNGAPLHVCTESHDMSLISSSEAGSFLAWIFKYQGMFSGPVNACSDGVTSPAQIISMIEAVVGRRASLVHLNTPEGFSLINHQATWTMSNHLARRLGFRFQSLQDWLPPLIKALAEQATQKARLK